MSIASIWISLRLASIGVLYNERCN